MVTRRGAKRRSPPSPAVPHERGEGEVTSDFGFWILDLTVPCREECRQTLASHPGPPQRKGEGDPAGCKSRVKDPGDQFSSNRCPPPGSPRRHLFGSFRQRGCKKSRSGGDY